MLTNGAAAGKSGVLAAVVRGPADVPHPRALRLLTDPGPVFEMNANPVGDAAWTGLWRTRHVTSEPDPSGLLVSLWWFTLAGLAANGVTLVRLWRRRGRAGKMTG